MRKHEVWVLTAAYHRTDLEQAMLRSPELRDRIHFVFVDEKPWHYRPTPGWIRIENSIAKPIMNRAYRSWQRGAYAAAKKLHRRIGFDLIHQLTYVGFRFPGHLWKLGIPFVWGPLGGLENTPWRLLPEMGIRGATYYAARNVVNSYHKNYLRRPLNGFRRARAVIAATSAIQREIFKYYGVSSEVICEVGLPCPPAPAYTRRAAGEPIRIAWSGLHLPGKALPMLLRAMRAVAADWRLDIYGDGPCNRQWRALALRLGIDRRCTWHRQVSREEALAGMRRAHLFAITSLKDLTSTVIIEALANGVPVVCPDHCGFSDVINAECGIKLPISSAREFERRLSGAIDALAADEDRRRRLAAGALIRARDYAWEAKAAAIERVYERALATPDPYLVFNRSPEELAADR